MKKISNLQQLVAAVLADVKQTKQLAILYETDVAHVQSVLWCLATERCNRVNFDRDDGKILGYIWTHARCQLRREQPITQSAYAKFKCTKTINNQRIIVDSYLTFGELDVSVNDDIEFGAAINFVESNTIFDEAEALDAMPNWRKSQDGMAGLDNSDIRNYINSLATVKGAILADRTKREKIQLNSEHFEMGDLETARVGILVVVKKSGRAKKSKVFLASQDTKSGNLFGGV